LLELSGIQDAGMNNPWLPDEHPVEEVNQQVDVPLDFVGEVRELIKNTQFTNDLEVVVRT
jgi:hypothetical protein